jgi:hypothetical protein
VFQSLIAKILITVLFLKIMFIMYFDDFFIPQIFLDSFRPPAKPPRRTCGPLASHQCAEAQRLKIAALRHEDVWGVEVYLHHSRPRRYMEVGGQLHAPANLSPGEKPQYPLDRMLGQPQNRSGRRREEKNLSLSGIDPGPSRPSLICLQIEVNRDKHQSR